MYSYEHFISKYLVNPLVEPLLQNASCSTFVEVCCQYKYLKKWWASLNASSFDTLFNRRVTEWITSLSIQTQTIEFNSINIEDEIVLLSLLNMNHGELLVDTKRAALHYFEKNMQLDELSSFSDATVYEKGKQFCLLLKCLKDMKGFDLSSLLTLTNMELYIQLTLHHALLQECTSHWVELSVSLLGMFSQIDTLYYKLFLLRWNSGCSHAIELSIASRLCSTTTVSNIQSILDNPILVNESLVTPFIGNAKYILPITKLEDYSYLRKFSKKSEHRSFYVHTQLGSCCLQVDGFSIYCCPAQLLILLMFEKANKLRMHTIISQSPFDPDTTQQIVKSLTCCSVGLLYVTLPEQTHDVQLPSLLSIQLGTVEKDETPNGLFDSQEKYE